MGVTGDGIVDADPVQNSPQSAVPVDWWEAFLSEMTRIGDDQYRKQTKLHTTNHSTHPLPQSHFHSLARSIAELLTRSLSVNSRIVLSFL